MSDGDRTLDLNSNNMDLLPTVIVESSITRTAQVSTADTAKMQVIVLTWEMVIWVGILCLAAVLRLAELGSAPLAPEEASGALSSWRLYHGQATEMPQGSLLAYGSALVFFLFGASDVTARLLPALSGIALVGVPALLRQQFGRVPALVCALFLAVSPPLVLFSRRVDNAMLVALLSIAVLAFVLKLTETGRTWWGYAAGVGMGALAVSGPAAYPAIVALLCFGIARYWRDLKAWRRDGGAMPQSAAQDRSVHGESVMGGALFHRVGLTGGYIGVVVVVALLIATGFLSNLHGIQVGVIDPAANWVGGLLSVNPFSRLVSIILSLFIYDPLMTVLGAMAAIMTVLDIRAIQGGWLWWLVATFLLAPPIGSQAATAVVLPMVAIIVLSSLPAGQAVAWLGRPTTRHDIIPLAAVCLPLLWLAMFAQAHLARPHPVVPSVAGAVPLIVLLLAVAVFIHRMGWQRTARAACVIGVGLVGIMGLHTTSDLQRDGVELLSGVASSADVRTLATDIKNAQDALRVLAREGNVSVQPSLRLPLDWYLRDIDVTYADSPDASDDLFVASANSPAPAWRHVSQRYQLLRFDQSRVQNFGQAWLWYFYREPIGQTGTFGVVLHVRV